METTTAKSDLYQLIWLAAVGLFAVAMMTGTADALALSAEANKGNDVAEHTITNMQAALERHDTRAFHTFRADLIGRVGRADFQSALDQYRTVIANLAEAGRRHDTQAQARYRAQIALMCGRETLVSGPEHCDIAVAAARGRMRSKFGAYRCGRASGPPVTHVRR